MEINRRQFLKISGASAVGIAFGSLGFDMTPIESYAYSLRIIHAKQTSTICPYCAVGCGILVHTIDGNWPAGCDTD